MKEALLFYEYMPHGTADRAEDLRVLLHASRPRWVIGNGTFCETARLLGDGKSCDEAGRILAAQFGIDFDRAIQDVWYVADRLSASGMLDKSGKESPVRIPEPRSLFIYVTGRCNLSCDHCYNTEMPRDDFPPHLYRRTVDELVQMGGKSIVLGGGEPLLHPELKELLTYGGRHCAMNLLTNGALLDGEWARILSDLEDVSIQISLDGAHQEVHDAIRGKGAFAKALKAIGHLHEAGLGKKIVLAATAMAGNLADLPELVDLADRLGVPHVRYQVLRKKGNAERKWDLVGAPVAEDDYERFFDRMLQGRNGNGVPVEVSCGLSGFMLVLPEGFPADDLWCPVGKQIIVTPQGDAFPCVLLQGENFALGNVFRDGLARVTASEKMARTCSALAARRERIAECVCCPWRNLCQGGCMGEALEQWGTVWERDRFCSYRRKLYERSFVKLLDRAARSGR